MTPLELFFDLVFVFAFTQVTLVLSDNPTWSGLGARSADSRSAVVGVGGLRLV